MYNSAASAYQVTAAHALDHGEKIGGVVDAELKERALVERRVTLGRDATLAQLPDHGRGRLAAWQRPGVVAVAVLDIPREHRLAVKRKGLRHNCSTALECGEILGRLSIPIVDHAQVFKRHLQSQVHGELPAEQCGEASVKGAGSTQVEKPSREAK
jgi:hypothetical protein